MLKLSSSNKLSFSALIIVLMLLAQFSLQTHNIEHMTHDHEELCTSYLLADHQIDYTNNLLATGLAVFTDVAIFSLFTALFSFSFSHYISRAPPLKVY
ncbi:MAG: hypothetical protein ISR69_00815 [Gammaproteobacteria bacterium]|nr:hypothetical protein [Gammaproteobacteria bacterium]